MSNGRFMKKEEREREEALEREREENEKYEK